MLISLSHKFIFVANLKTGSTSIERMLRPEAEICLDRSEWGKHISVGHVVLRFARIFEMVPLSDFFVFGALRDPVDWIGSLYRSHRSSQFRGTSLDTSDMDFESFLQDWIPRNVDQTQPQVTTLIGNDGRLGVDYILRYEHLDRDLGEVCDIVGMPRVVLPNENASVDLPIRGGLSSESVGVIRRAYACDQANWSLLAGRRLSPTERCSADIDWARDWSRDWSSAPAPRGEPGPDVMEAGAIDDRGPMPPRPLTKDDVIWAFRYLLGREPENEAVIAEHQALGSIAALRERIMGSSEFRGHVGDAANGP